MPVVRRDVSTFLQRIRAFLLGREHNSALRFEDAVADRTQPPPNLPEGPSHVLSKNYYYTRDARSTVLPPIDILKRNELASGQNTEKASDTGKKLPTPGVVHHWD